MVEPGFFGIPDLNFIAWVLVKTYGEMILTSYEKFLSESFCNKRLTKKLAFSCAPPENLEYYRLYPILEHAITGYIEFDR